MKVAVYPGSFDPITNGHLKILYRSLSLFDKVIVLVANNPTKTPRFNVEERVNMIKESVKDLPNVEVDSTDGLSIEYAKKVGATHLIRGLRAVSDFEYEFQLNSANNFIDKEIDMVFLMSSGNDSFINSSTIVDMYLNGVDVSSLVPEPVLIGLAKLVKHDN
ncbi:MAG: pantetheine-phosphate adenylyltransferase [Coprobacillus sp.]|nr:pantetheine-phosphate adenylyltransferase [Coprobacillus sp.]